MSRITAPHKVRWYLREWRESRHMTLEQVAERCDTNKGQIAKLENGRQRMNDRWIESLAAAFNVKPGRLLEHPNTPTVDDLLEGASLDDVQTVRSAVAMLLKKRA